MIGVNDETPPQLFTEGQDKRKDELFLGYIQYFHEVTWLLMQKTFQRLCLADKVVSAEQLQPVSDTQRQAWLRGERLHLGRALVDSGVIGEQKVFAALEKLGSQVRVCNTCDQVFHYIGQEKDVPKDCFQCAQELRQTIADREIVQQITSMSQSWPRLIDKRTAPHNSFLFLDIAKYARVPRMALESEIHSLLQLFCHWLATTLPMPTAQQSSEHSVFGIIDQEFTTPLPITKKITRVMLQSDIVKKEQEPAFTVVFLGYLQNVREFFWLMRQRMFEELCLARKYISASEMEQALTVQSRAFDEKKRLHIAEALLQMYLLNEQQIYQLLQVLGNEFLICGKCNQYFHAFSPALLDICGRCGESLQKTLPEREVLISFLRESTQMPYPLAREVPAATNQFTFFSQRAGYQPDFTLTTREISAAFGSFRHSLDLDKPSKKQDPLNKRGTLYIESLVSAQKEEDEDDDFLEPRGTLFMEQMGDTDEEPVEEPRRQESFLGKLRRTLAIPSFSRTKPEETSGHIHVPIDRATERAKTESSQEQEKIIEKMRNTFSMSEISREERDERKETVVRALLSKTLAIRMEQQKLAEQKTKKQPVWDKLRNTLSIPMLKRTKDTQRLAKKEILRGEVTRRDDMNVDRIIKKLEESLGRREEGEEAVERGRRDPERQVTRRDDMQIDRILEKLGEALGTAAPEKDPPKKEAEMDRDRILRELDETFGVSQDGKTYSSSYEALAAASGYDALAISQEVEDFMESMDNLDALSQDDIYERFLEYSRQLPAISLDDEKQGEQLPPKQARERKEVRVFPAVVPAPMPAQPPKDLPNVNRYRSAVPTQLENIGDYGRPRMVPRPTRNARWPLVLMGLAFIGLCYIVIRPYFASPSVAEEDFDNDRTQRRNRAVLREKTDRERIQEVEETAAIEREDSQSLETPQDRSLQPLQEKPRGPSALARQLQGVENSREIAKKLFRLSNSSGSLSEQDVPMLRQLYQEHSQSKRVRLMVIRCMGNIAGESARLWLEELLLNPTNATDRATAVKTLEKIGDNRSTVNIVNLLRRESDTKVAMTCAYALSKLAPQSEEVQQALIAKFYEVSDKALRLRILTAIGSMKIATQNTFLVQVAIDGQYSIATRVEAINSLMINSTGNAASHISELSTLSTEQDKALRKKAKEAIRVLSGSSQEGEDEVDSLIKEF